MSICLCGCEGIVISPDKQGRIRRFIKNHCKKRENHHLWKGGRKIIDGYVFIYKPDHPYANKTGYVTEHRLVMEEYLGRYLERGKTRKDDEIAHHVDEVKDHNDIENLELCLFGVHTRYHWTNKKHSLDSKIKMSNSAKGHTRNLGSKRSLETRERISIAQKKRFGKNI